MKIYELRDCEHETEWRVFYFSREAAETKMAEMEKSKNRCRYGYTIDEHETADEP